MLSVSLCYVLVYRGKGGVESHALRNCYIYMRNLLGWLETMLAQIIVN